MSKAIDIDIERCVTDPIEQKSGRQPPPSSKPGRRCAIAVQHLDGRAVLINTAIEEVDGNLVFSSAEKQISRAVARGWHQRLRGNLLMGVVVGTARVKQVIHSGPQPYLPGDQGSRIPPPRVCLQDFTLDSLLTEALNNPQLLLRSDSYPLDVTNTGSSPDGKFISSCTEHDDPEVIVVRRVIDRAKVAWLLILLLFFSPVLGIGVGICSHDADVGIAVSAGMFALASFVQGLVAWVQG